MSVRIKLLALVSVLAIVAAACGSESDDGTPSAGGDTGSSVDVVDAIGDTEGELNLIAWPGYTEKGWVKPFEDETGCKVSVKYGNTSDDMVNLIRNNPGQYDGVSASGDATNRLIASGNVSAIDPALFPELSDVTASLNPESGANTAHYVVDGNVYGVPYMYGPNFLMFNTDEVSPAPDSWDVVFETEIDGAPNPYAGMVTAYDSAIYIADAALYLKTHQPDLGITDPYELTTDQLDAAVELLKKQATMITKYWAIYTDEIDGFDSGDMVIGTAWPVNQQYITKVPVDNVIPSEGRHRLGGHLDDDQRRSPSQLHAEVDGVHARCEGPDRGGAVLRRDAFELGRVRRSGQGAGRRRRDLPLRRRRVPVGHLPLEDPVARLRRRPGQYVRRLQRLDREVARGPERFLIDAMTTAIEGRATGPRSHVPS